jgi:uncharacterized protein (TIGR02145 family)
LALYSRGSEKIGKKMKQKENIRIRKNRWICLFLLLGTALLLAANCNKDNVTKPFVDHTGETGTVTDIDGNSYATIGIGSQIWMAENLKVTKYRNGATLPEVQDNNQWKNLATGAYCSYNNNTGFSAVYGLLYNWHAVNDQRNLAPEGWHIPTDEEWDILINWLGGDSTAGGKLKEAGTAHWALPNAGATNISGFSALPGGWRLNMGDFFYSNTNGYWWTKSNDFLPGSFAYAYGLLSDSTNIVSYATIQNFGLSVRCIKNSE